MIAEAFEKRGWSGWNACLPTISQQAYCCRGRPMPALAPSEPHGFAVTGPPGRRAGSCPQGLPEYSTFLLPMANSRPAASPVQF